MRTQRMRITASYAMISVLLVHTSILAWNAAHFKHTRSGIQEATRYISAFTERLLPVQSPTSQQEKLRFFELTNRNSPTWTFNHAGSTGINLVIDHLIGLRSALPYGNGNLYTYDSPLLLVLFQFLPAGLIAVLVVYVVLWDRYLRQTNPKPTVFWSLIGDLNKTVLFLLPLPFCIGVFFKWYLHLSSNIILLRNPGPLRYFAPFTVEAPTQITLAILMLGIYPLVFCHLRWRRAAKLAASGATTTHCQRCGYPVEALDLCPECGTPKAAKPDPKLSRRRKRILIAGYLAFPLLLIAPFWLSWVDMLL